MMSDETTGTEKQPPHGEHPHHEEEDVNVSAIAWTTVALFAVLVITGLVVAGTRYWYGSEHPNPKLSSRFEQVEKVRTAEPGVEIQPRRLFERVRTENLTRLSTYKWLDPQRSRAQIPIERAIEIIEQQGLQPQRPQQEEESSP